jgi:OOP family OmpA-OmpF porin
MNKLALSAAVAALALSPVLSQAAHADDADTVAPRSPYGANINPSWQDNFFVAGQIGQTQYRDSYLTHNHSVFQNVRFGWRWNGIVGPEIGYAYLGRPKFDATYPNGLGEPVALTGSVRTRALTVGVNGKYNVYDNWFVTGHAGYLRSQSKSQFTAVNFSTDGSINSDKSTAYNDGWYAGLGVGYDLTRNFSVGLNYDNYHLNQNADGPGVNVAAYSASVEYRF